MQHFVSQLFQSTRQRCRRRHPEIVAAEVLEDRILLAVTNWTDGAPNDHDFKTNANWDFGRPTAADTGVFDSIGGFVDVTTMENVGRLNFNGIDNIDLDFAEDSQLHVGELNVGKQVNGGVPLDQAEVTINGRFADSETSFIADKITIGTQGHARLTINGDAHSGPITMGGAWVAGVPPGGWESSLTIETGSSISTSSFGFPPTGDEWPPGRRTAGSKSGMSKPGKRCSSDARTTTGSINWFSPRMG